MTADEATIKAVTRGDVMALYKEYFRPGRAIVTVAGDIDAAAAKTARMSKPTV